MIIYRDTREQQPLPFTSFSEVKEVKDTTLPYGDYACKIDNEKIPVVFERKSISDLFGTLGKGHQRFRRECNKAIKDEILLIIITEANLNKIRKGYKYSKKMKGISVIRTLFSLMIKHHIPFVTCHNRKEMELYIVEFFYSYAKHYMKQ